MYAGNARLLSSTAMSMCSYIDMLQVHLPEFAITVNSFNPEGSMSSHIAMQPFKYWIPDIR